MQNDCTYGSPLKHSTYKHKNNHEHNNTSWEQIRISAQETEARSVNFNANMLRVLRLIHTATRDTTKQSCLRRVRLGGVNNWIPDNSRLSPTENVKSEHVQSNRPIHTRHYTDRTVLSGLAGSVNWAL